MLREKFFLLILATMVLSGCATSGTSRQFSGLSVFGVPIFGFTKTDNSATVGAKARATTLQAEGYRAVADGVAQSVTPENAHLIPISPDDPRSITTGKVEANGNANISIRQGGGDPPPRTYDYGQPGNFGNGHWHVGR